MLTSFMLDDCIAIEAQVPEAISIRSDGTRLFWCDMLQREAASMYELAAPVQVSPHVWVSGGMKVVWLSVDFY
jgi:hypothetical protein